MNLRSFSKLRSGDFWTCLSVLRWGLADDLPSGDASSRGSGRVIPSLRKLEGGFFRSVLADRVDTVLAPLRPGSAGRYHRPGQAALYMSPTLEWSMIAVSGYIREDGCPRVVVPLMVREAYVLDQHDDEACRLLGIDRELSNAPWRPALRMGQEPPSWRNADVARAAGADGIIDRSRMIPEGWHVTLFRLNELGGPSVTVCGDPIAINPSADGPKWGL